MKKQIHIWLWLLCLTVLLTACASGVTRVQEVPLSRQVPDEPTAATAAPVTEAPTQAPTETPTQAPTQTPTEAPTEAPTETATEAPAEASTQAPTEAPTEPSTEAPTALVPDDPAPDSATSPDRAVHDYVINTNTGKFHEPSCSSVKQIKDANRWDFTGTREEVIEMGYEPCKRCNP